MMTLFGSINDISKLGNLSIADLKGIRSPSGFAFIRTVTGTQMRNSSIYTIAPARVGDGVSA